MSPDLIAAIIATQIPFAAFVLILVFFRSRPALSAGLSIGTMGAAFVSCLCLVVCHAHMSAPVVFTGRWLAAAQYTIPFGFYLDPVSLQMLMVVTTICLLVQIYSLGYMAGDPGFCRYYALMSLFAWAMGSLSLSPTLVQLYIFWELVGLASYLLIGFWYEKFSASQAGKKAFVMTRVGDVGFFLGLLLVLYALGDLNFMTLNAPAAAGRMGPVLLGVSGLLIFCGIIGKSAQFPLMTWLPDAMEGPTPVSALLHSATMVAAGVFLLVRLFPFFSRCAWLMGVCMAVGCASMLLAATMAMVSRDIKQIWAYSTISQLGLMIMGLAAGDLFAGFFHLTTHAGFKALLFLCSGVFIHAYGTNDAVELGKRGCRRLKTPMICLVIGAAALAGLPPFSGFFSKESIMGALAGLQDPVWLMAALLGVFLTAYYAFRLIFFLLAPDPSTETQAEAHAEAGHADPAAYRWMAWPLVVLAGITGSLGFFRQDLSRFLTGAAMGPETGHGLWLQYLAMGLSATGMAVAWFEFARPGASRKGFVERLPAVAAFFADRWRLDRLYRYLVDQFLDRGISLLCARNDQRVIDGGIDGMAAGTVLAGRQVSLLHQGTIQYRLTAAFLVMVFLGLYFFL